MDRTPLSTLLISDRGRERALRFREPSRASANPSHQQAVKHDMLLIIGHYGKVVGMVGVEDLFDADGNRFQDDRE
jgi:hypothetical protein